MTAKNDTNPHRHPLWCGLCAGLLIGLVALAGCDLTIDGESVFKKPPAEDTDGEKDIDDLYDRGTAVLDQGGPRKVFQTDASHLTIWRDPQFRREFMDSYVAVTEVEPPVSEEQRPVLQEILLMMQDGRTEEAIARLQEVRGPDATPQFDFLLGNLYLQRKPEGDEEKPDSDYEKAAAAFTVATKRFPRFRRAWKQLGLTWVQLKQYDRAATALSRAAGLGDNHEVTYGLLGYSQLQLDNPISAESAYRMAMMIKPDRLDWKMGLIHSFFGQKRFAEAAALAGELLKENTSKISLWDLQTKALLGMGKNLKAAQNLEMIDAMGRSSYKDMALLGDIYVNEKLHNPALSAYQRAIDQTDADTLSDDEVAKRIDRILRAAKALAIQGTEASDQASALLADIQDTFTSKISDEQQTELLKLQARLANAEQQTEREAELLREIVKLNPRDGEALMLLGRFYSRNGQPEKAIETFEYAANVEGFEAEAKIGHAQVLAREGKFEDALPLLRQAYQLDPRANVKEYIEKIERYLRSR